METLSAVPLLLLVLVLVVVGAAAAAAEIVIDKEVEAVLPAASVTLNPKVLVPAFTGVPKRMPEVDQPRPVLQEPEQDVIDQRKGDVPPVALAPRYREQPRCQREVDLKKK